MSETTDFEKEIRMLLSEVDGEQERLARRVATAQEALTAAEHKRDTLREALRIYCDYHNIPYDATEIDQGLRKQFEQLTTKDALVKIGNLSGGLLLIKDVCRVLVRAGIFRDARNASGNVYGVLKRHPTVFEKLEKGKYRLREGHPEPTPKPLSETHPTVGAAGNGQVTEPITPPSPTPTGQEQPTTQPIPYG